MRRRDLLQALGLSLALPLAGRAASAVAARDPLRESFATFRAARKTHPLLAGWESLTPPGTETVAANVSGRWPEGLRGTLFRNGPGLWDRAGQRYQHWFDGDGLIQRWSIADGRVRHRAQFVQTPKMIAEQAAGRFLVQAAGTTIADARAISGPDDVNTANTSVLALDGKLYALWEGGSAVEIDRDTLATVGMKTWSAELEGVPFSAHPLRETDGTVWNYGQFGNRLVVYRIGANGQLKGNAVLDLPRGGYSHSFVQTASRLVFVLSPLVLDAFVGSFFESMRWTPELGSLAVIVDKNDLQAAPRLVELEAGMAYHYADAWDEADGGIGLRACWYASGDTAISPMAHLLRGDLRSVQPLHSAFVRIQLPPGAGTGRVERSGVSNVEFPVLQTPAAHSDLLMIQGSSRARHGLNDTLLQLDAQRERSQSCRLGSGIAVEEHLLVAADGRQYALGTAFDHARARTGLLLFRADRIGDGPVAQAWLERAMPLGFHGTWIGG